MKQAVGSPAPPPPPPSLPPALLHSTWQTCSLSHTTYIKEFPRNEDSDNILHEAAGTGQVEKLKQLLNASDSQDFVNRRDHLGCTPLRIAASAGCSECLLALLTYGADVHLTDIKAQTPLAAAVKQNKPHCVEILLKSGADPDGDKNNLCTPLCWAVLHNHLDIVQMLLDHGCDVNGIHPLAPHSPMFTPLHTAITYGHKEIFRVLLLAGAKTSLCHGDGKSLYQVAIEKHRSDPSWVQELYNHGVPLTKEESIHLISETDIQDPVLELLCCLLDEPRCLKSTCRIYIRNHLAHYKHLKNVNDLPLPEPLINYLMYR